MANVSDDPAYLRSLLDRAHHQLMLHDEEYRHQTPDALLAEIGAVLGEGAPAVQAPGPQLGPGNAARALLGASDAILGADLGELRPLVGPLAGEVIHEASSRDMTVVEGEEFDRLIEFAEAARGEVRRFLEGLQARGARVPALNDRGLVETAPDPHGHAHGCSPAHDPAIRCGHGPACGYCMPRECFLQAQVVEAVKETKMGRGGV